MGSVSSVDKSNSEARMQRPSTIHLPKLIAALALILPALIFIVAATLSYNRLYLEARVNLDAQVDLAHQHARRVFSIVDLAASQTEEALLAYEESEITAHDGDLSAKLDRLSAAVPEVEDIWVVDAKGRALVTSVITPAPRDIDFSQQDFFAAQRDGYEGTFVTDRLPGYFRPSQYFKVSYKRRTAQNGFRGVILISGDPRSFESFYAGMLGEGLSLMSLLRDDGAVLARVPARETASRMPPGSPFMRAKEASPERGAFQDVSPLDGVDRLIVYRSLAPWPVYIIAGIDVAKVKSQWLQAMARQLYFGLPATLALFLVSLAAIRQARRQADTLEELQQEVQRRAFAEEALRQANKMEAIGRLTGGVAHDFNNLLQVMLGRLARIHKACQQQTPPALRDIDAMQFAIDRAANLTHRLLAFSRQQPLRTDVIDVNRLIAGMTELVRQTAGNEIVIDTIYASDIWSISIDANQLENAILNLTSNARDAMGGAGRITIRTENLAVERSRGSEHVDLPPGDYVCISVADTGHGIPGDMIEKIFEPFFTTKPVGQGTGLGLSMVYGFLRQSGGTVGIVSEVGHGTIVRLYLPRASEQAREEKASAAVALADLKGSGVVLVVEDEVEVRRLVVDTLRDAGCTVLAAATARDGMRLLEDNPGIQLLLTDIGLPEGMSGIQLADLARQRRPDLRIIYMTGYVRGAGEPGAQIDPSHPVLNKPFTRDALIQRVHEALAVHSDPLPIP
jgi:signal transduction histidine kinase/ActR/RegA family two-component response regulator